jgi:hypothetical protein
MDQHDAPDAGARRPRQQRLLCCDWQVGLLMPVHRRVASFEEELRAPHRGTFLGPFVCGARACSLCSYRWRLRHKPSTWTSGGPAGGRCVAACSGRWRALPQHGPPRRVRLPKKSLNPSYSQILWTEFEIFLEDSNRFEKRIGLKRG